MCVSLPKWQPLEEEGHPERTLASSLLAWPRFPARRLSRSSKDHFEKGIFHPRPPAVWNQRAPSPGPDRLRGFWLDRPGKGKEDFLNN